MGPALDSYRCYRIWIWETCGIRVCDTVTWFPSKVPMPKSSSTGMIVASLRDIAHALQHPEPRSPLLPQSDSHKSALEQLITTLSTIVEPTPEPIPTNPPALNPAPTSEQNLGNSPDQNLGNAPDQNLGNSLDPSMGNSPNTDPAPPAPIIPAVPRVPINAVHNGNNQPHSKTTWPALILDHNDEDVPCPAHAIPPSESAAERLRVPMTPHVPIDTVTFDNATGPTGKKRRRKQRKKATPPAKPRTTAPKTTTQAAGARRKPRRR
jgi:hypothetical protein